LNVVLFTPVPTSNTTPPPTLIVLKPEEVRVAFRIVLPAPDPDIVIFFERLMLRSPPITFSVDAPLNLDMSKSPTPAASVPWEKLPYPESVRTPSSPGRAPILRPVEIFSTGAVNAAPPKLYVPLLPETALAAAAAINNILVPLAPLIATVPAVWLIVPEKPVAFTVELPTIIAEKLLVKFCVMFNTGAVVPLPDTTVDRVFTAADIFTTAPSALITGVGVELPGRPLDQFPAVFQSLLELPVQVVVCAIRLGAKPISRAALRVQNRRDSEGFFIVGFFVKSGCLCEQ